MAAKVIRTGDKVQEKVLNGVDKAVEAIKLTMGPSGKGVLISEFGGSRISRDGATVAKSIEFSDKEENMGADLVKKASSSSEERSGDGTSTTAILIQEFCKKGQRAVGHGANVNEIKSGMLKAGKWIENYIDKNAIPVGDDLEKVRKVATIAANNDSEIGDLIVEGMKKVGMSGLITVEISQSLDTSIAITEGMKLDRGWASPHYADPATGVCTLENPFILVTGERLSSIPQIMSLMTEYGQHSGGRPLLVITEDIDELVTNFFIINTLRGALRVCVVKGIDYGDGRKNIMQDVATATGAVYVCPENAKTIAETTLADLGSARKVVIDKDKTIIYEGNGDPEAVKARAEVLKSRLESDSVSQYDKTKFEKRLANLVGGIAVIRVGGSSEAESQNKKDIVEDAVLASKCAVEEGCLPGGGYTYIKAGQAIMKDKDFWKGLTEDTKEGAMIVVNALPIVLKTISNNCGMSSDVILNEFLGSKKENWGFNAKTKRFEDLIGAGVLDSAKVLRVAIENAISAASMILLIGCTIYDEDKKNACDCNDHED